MTSAPKASKNAASKVSLEDIQRALENIEDDDAQKRENEIMNEYGLTEEPSEEEPTKEEPVKEQVKEEPTKEQVKEEPNTITITAENIEKLADAPPLSKKEIEERKSKLISNISKQIEQIEKSDEYSIDLSKYRGKSGEKYNIFLFGKIKMPQSVAAGKITASSLVKKLTIFDEYESFGKPSTHLIRQIPNRIISLKNLNTTFSYEFINPSKYNKVYHLDDLPEVISKFFIEKGMAMSIDLEYDLIMYFLQKLIALLCTYEELAFSTQNYTPDAQFKITVDKDIDVLKSINPNCKMYRSWRAIITALFDTTERMKVFRFKSYPELNSLFETAFMKENREGLLLEQVLGNALKTRLPSITFSYIYAVRSVYVFARFLSIYIQERRYVRQTFERVATDIYHMAVVATSLYEAQWQILSQCAKSFPRLGGGKELSPQTKEYINTHILTSGVYYFVKMFEESAPWLANKLLQS